MKIFYLSMVILFAGLNTAVADSFKLGDLHIEQPWSRATPPVATTGAAYLNIKNSGTSADKLIAASADIAKKVEIHTHIMENNMMKMQRIDVVEIPAGQDVIFAPGGKHIMLMGIEQPLVAERSFPVMLRFEKAGEITVTVTIKAP